MEPLPQEQTATRTTVARMTRGIAVILAVATALANVPGIKHTVIQNFALRPVATIAESKLWNVVTAGFFELHPLGSLINILLFLTMGRWIETSWGGASLLAFLLLVNTLAAIFTNAFLFAAYLATRIESLMFTPIGTTNGICVAQLVAVKQLIPDHEIGVRSATIRANYLPIGYIIIITVLAIAQLAPVGVLVFTIAAFQTSWLYLRFVQRKTDSRGDLSEAFAFATFFPDPFRSFVAVFANLLFTIFSPLLVPRRTAQPDVEQQPPIQQSKASAMDAERRRQRALKALDERLSTAPKPDEQSDLPV